jgi:hypothetical protein
MAAEVGSAPVNGYGHGNAASYAANAYGHQPTASATSSQAGYNAAAPVAGASGSSSQTDISKEQVAWYFVESYYTTMSQQPEKLHVCRVERRFIVVV